MPETRHKALNSSSAPHPQSQLTQTSIKLTQGVYKPHLRWAGLDPAAARLQFSSLPQQQFNPSGCDLVHICQQHKALNRILIYPLTIH